jgi:RyR domain
VSDETGSIPYKPELLDPSAVQLSDWLQQQLETLAESVHDNWAATRIEMGWSYGPRIDDDKKQHPGLVPYSQLTESEKNIDRRVVLTVLFGMQKLGCEMLPPA